jgi:hypothetical protein
MDVRVSALEGRNLFFFQFITEGDVQFSFTLDRQRAKRFADLIDTVLDTNESQQANPI